MIDSKTKLIVQKPGIQGVYEQIELAGRTSYKSEHKIVYDEDGNSTTAKDFTERLRKAKHGAALEHGTVYLTIPSDEYGARQAIAFYIQDEYSECRTADGDKESTAAIVYYITTNYRVVVEAGRESDLKWLAKEMTYHEPRYTIRFTLSRAIANEFVRHRVFSFLQESTRYVKYVDGIEIIKPYWYDDAPQDVQAIYETGIGMADTSYRYLLQQGCKAQQARGVLPLDTKTELVMTGTREQWRGFFNLRSTECGAKGVHPDASKLADEAYKLISEQNDR